MKNLDFNFRPAARRLLVFGFLAANSLTNSVLAQNDIKLTQQGGKVSVSIGGKEFTQYLFGTDELKGCKKPVLFPILTSGQTPITRGYPLQSRPNERVDHPHHVGSWLNYGDVNGHDFWNNSTDIGPDHKGLFGTIVHTGIVQTKSGKRRGELTVTADWLDTNGKPLLRETTTFVFSAEGEAVRLIDRTTTLTAADKEVVLKDNKEGLVAIRVARQLEHPSKQPEIFTDASGKATAVPTLDNTGVTGRYRNSEGVEGDDAWGKRARWVNLTGRIGSEDVSLVIIDHPKNTGYPTYWHARGYGLFAANPLGP
ncbi:MAG: PmoA family protein, partial [Cytophagales bacterium]|nr:PmoA family protein [Cytophagales bacterium]